MSNQRIIRESHPDIVLVGLGCPRQEIWVAQNTLAIGVPCLAVGAVFDFLSGNKRRPPQWTWRLGLEWLGRLLYEPRRLCKRYAKTNSLFLFCWLRQALGCGAPLSQKKSDLPLVG